jgi:hypothetical protein
VTTERPSAARARDARGAGRASVAAGPVARGRVLGATVVRAAAAGVGAGRLVCSAPADAGARRDASDLGRASGGAGFGRDAVVAPSPADVGGPVATGRVVFVAAAAFRAWVGA